MANALEAINSLRRSISRIKSIDDAKDVRDKAESLRKYFKSRGDSLDAEIAAAECRILAEWQCGRILEDLLIGHRRKKGSHDATLSDIGLTKSDSSRWQLEARMPHEDLLAYFAKCRDSQCVPTSKAVQAAVRRALVDDDDRHGVNGGLASGRVCGEWDEIADQKYGCVYADPPWPYDNRATRGAAEDYYSTMSLDDIKALPVADIANDNAHLHLWTTNGFLEQSFDVIRAWGFVYKSCRIWVKPQLGTGNYWRLSHEFLLFGIRGKCPFRDRSLRSWVEADRESHSRKPSRFRMDIEAASPGPYVELFGREPIEGWTVFGNQIDARLFAG